MNSAYVNIDASLGATMHVPERFENIISRFSSTMHVPERFETIISRFLCRLMIRELLLPSPRDVVGFSIKLTD